MQLFDLESGVFGGLPHCSYILPDGLLCCTTVFGVLLLVLCCMLVDFEPCLLHCPCSSVVEHCLESIVCLVAVQPNVGIGQLFFKNVVLGVVEMV